MSTSMHLHVITICTVKGLVVQILGVDIDFLGAQPDLTCHC